MTDRRDFSRRSVLPALAPALPTPVLEPSLAESSSARSDRVGLQLYTVRHQMEKDFEGTIARVAATATRRSSSRVTSAGVRATYAAMPDHRPAAGGKARSEGRRLANHVPVEVGFAEWLAA